MSDTIKEAIKKWYDLSKKQPLEDWERSIEEIEDKEDTKCVFRDFDCTVTLVRYYAFLNGITDKLLGIHLEWLAYGIVEKKSNKTISQNLSHLFEYIFLFFDKPIYGIKANSQRLKHKWAFTYAHEMSKIAVNKERDGDYETALEIWKKLFNNK